MYSRANFIRPLLIVSRLTMFPLVWFIKQWETKEKKKVNIQIVICKLNKVHEMSV